MNPVCIWNRAFRWPFCHNYFFFVSQFHVKRETPITNHFHVKPSFYMTSCQKDFFFAATLMCSFKKLSQASCSFKKLSPKLSSFIWSFKKLSQDSASFKKLSQVSCQVSKINVTFVCTSGETIRHFAKKKTRLQ